MTNQPPELTNDDWLNIGREMAELGKRMTTDEPVEQTCSVCLLGRDCLDHPEPEQQPDIDALAADVPCEHCGNLETIHPVRGCPSFRPDVKNLIGIRLAQQRQLDEKSEEINRQEAIVTKVLREGEDAYGLAQATIRSLQDRVKEQESALAESFHVDAVTTRDTTITERDATIERAEKAVGLFLSADFSSVPSDAFLRAVDKMKDNVKAALGEGE